MTRLKLLKLPHEIIKMQLIVISGPSGSGKTTISKKILKNLKNGIILNTDNYYRTGIISNIYSKIITSYFDKKISFNKKLFKKDLDFILKNRYSKYSYKYDFKTKSTKKIFKKTKSIRYIIIEGIFGKEIIKTLYRRNCILIELKTSKKSCMKRVVKRDYNKRGKSKNVARRDFFKAWELFHKNEVKNGSIKYLKKISIKKKLKIKLLIKNIINILN